MNHTITGTLVVVGTRPGMLHFEIEPGAVWQVPVPVELAKKMGSRLKQQQPEQPYLTEPITNILVN